MAMNEDMVLPGIRREEYAVVEHPKLMSGNREIEKIQLAEI